MSPPFLQSWKLFSPHFEPIPHSPVPKPKLSFQVVSSLLTILALVAWWWVAACFHSAAHTVLTQLALVCMCALVYMCALGTWNLCTWHLCTWHLCTWHLCTCVLVSCRMFSFRCWYGVDTTVAPPSLYPSTSISPSLSITLKPAYYIRVRGSSHQKLWQMCQIRCPPPPPPLTSGCCWWALSPKTTSVTLCRPPSHVDSTFLVSNYSGVQCPVLKPREKETPRGRLKHFKNCKCCLT